MNAEGWILSDSMDLGSVTPEVNEGAVAPSPPTLTDLSSDGWGGVIPVDVGVVEPRLDSLRPVSWSGWADLTAMFDAPASDGGSPVRSVDVTATDIDTGEQLSCSTIPSASSCTLGGVRPGETYVVTATATNGAGTSAAPLAFAPASDVPAFPIPAAAAVEPAASSEPGPSTARVALASSHVADRVASSSSGGSMLLVGVLGLLLTVSLLVARVRRPRT